MSAQLLVLEKKLLDLPRSTRMFLADRLISSLNMEELDSIDQSWVKEADKRYAAYQAGKTELLSLEQVLQAAEKALK